MLKFLSKVLEIPEEVLDLVEITKITRLTKGPSVTDEAIIRFVTVSIRDTIRSYGPKLQGKQAKMSMVVLTKLKEEERELEGIAWKIRSSKDGTKTRLRFDDGAQGLKLMTKSPGGKWKAASKIC